MIERYRESEEMKREEKLFILFNFYLQFIFFIRFGFSVQFYCIEMLTHIVITKTKQQKKK